MTTEATVSLIFSGVVAIATVVYAVLTWALVSETRRLRRVQTDAKVVASVVQSQWAFGFVDLLIRNDGGGPAVKVRFEIVEEPPGSGDPETLKTLMNFGFIKNGIDHMSSGTEVRTFLVTMLGRQEEQMSTNVRLNVTYSSATGENHRDSYPLDLSPFWSILRIGNPPIETIAKEAEQIRKILDTMSDRLK